jgi:chromosome segregation ATPase
MSLSGNDVLALIERTHLDTRNEIVNVSTRLARFTAELETLRQREIGVLSVLARIRMREIEGDELSAALDETGKRVKELLGRREGALAAVTEKLAAAERQQAALQQERAEQQRVVGAAERAVDEAEAAAQQALGADAGYRAKLDAAAASDKVADSAEAKATAAHADREQKGKPYEADALFAYLWGRGFGTPAYAHGGLTRALDGWVARVADYEPHRRDYWLLTELPARFDEHAQRMRAQADADLAAVQALEKAAAEAAGVPARQKALEETQAALAAIDERIEEQEAAVAALAGERAAFAAGDDDLSRQCNELIRETLKREQMRTLRERATATPSKDDDAAVDELTEIRANLPRIEAEAARLRALHEANTERVAKLDEIRKRFKESRYDAVSSEFVNGALIAALLTQLLAGSVGLPDFWDALKKQQRYRQLADPRFGSGRFPRGGAGPWHNPGGWGGGGFGGRGGSFGRGGGFGGGGFKSGGGFGGGGFKTGGKF